MFAGSPFSASPFASGGDLASASLTEASAGADISVAVFTLAALSDFYRYDIPGAAGALRFDVPQTSTGAAL